MEEVSKHQLEAIKFKGMAVKWSTIATIILLTVVVFGMWGCPRYSVYQQDLTGKAELARADQNRKITIAEAQAKLESSKFLNQAEVERAKGVAEANQIIGDSLDGNDEYLRYLWIDAMERTKSKVIYVPTEAGLPILEAGKR